MTSKKKTKAGMTARQMKATLRKMPAKVIIEELTRRGLTIGIDYEAVLNEVHKELYWLNDEVAQLNCDESGDDAELFEEVADNLQDILWYIEEKTGEEETTGKEGTTPSIDYKAVLDEVWDQMNETEALFDCNMKDCDDDGNREQMAWFSQRASYIRWNICKNSSIEEYIRLEELTEKYK